MQWYFFHGSLLALVLDYCLHSIEREQMAPSGSYTVAVATPFVELGSLSTNVPRLFSSCIVRLESRTKRKLHGECLEKDSSFSRTWSGYVYLRAT